MKQAKAQVQMPALFSYRNGDSIVHRMPAGAKLILLCVISIRTFSASDYGLHSGGFSAIPLSLIPWIRAAAYGIIDCAALLAARTPAASLKKLAFVPILGAFIAIANLTPSAASGFQNYHLDIESISESILYTFRLLVTAAAALIVFETTSRLQIYDALESAENGAAKICPTIKRFRIAQTLSITITFIPEIVSSWNEVSLAAKARFPRRPKKRAHFGNAVRTLYAECTALFLNLLQYAEDTRRAVSNREPQGKCQS